MKTDLQIKTDVVAELAWTPIVDSTNVGVAVKDGVVTVSGSVDTFAQKQAIEQAVRQIAGVRGVVVGVDVRLAPGHRRSDAEIAQSALEALRWHSLVPDDHVKVEVEDGWVTLSGEVDWGYQAATADQAVLPLVGVRGVTNNIRLKRQVDAGELRTGILAALARHARREAGHISIEVEGGTVTLNGKVDSLAEHDATVGTVKAAKGVMRIVDHLQLNP